MILFLKIFLYTAQGLALAAAIYKWKENKNTSQKYFLHLMVVIVIIEITANAIRAYTPFSNSIIYNPYIIFSFLFYFYWFYKILLQKKLVLFLTSIFLLLVPVSIYLEDFCHSFLDIVIYSGSISIVTFSFIYLRQLMSSDEIVSFSKSQPFWITSGLLIFYVGFLPMSFLQDVIGFNKTYFQFVMMVLNITLYGCFAKAFLCPLKK